MALTTLEMLNKIQEKQIAIAYNWNTEIMKLDGGIIVVDDGQRGASNGNPLVLSGLVMSMKWKLKPIEIHDARVVLSKLEKGETLTLVTSEQEYLNINSKSDSIINFNELFIGIWFDSVYDQETLYEWGYLDETSKK